MGNIAVRPEDVWDFFYDGLGEHDDDLLASNHESGYGVNIVLHNNHGFPEIIVLDDDDPIDEVICWTKDDLESKVAEFYNEYIESSYDNSGIYDPYEEIETDDMEYMIADREDELDFAVQNLFDTLAPSYFGDDESKICDDIKEQVCSYLYTKYGISIYRPMILEDDGKKEFFEYPYDEMEIPKKKTID